MTTVALTTRQEPERERLPRLLIDSLPIRNRSNLLRLNKISISNREKHGSFRDVASAGDSPLATSHCPSNPCPLVFWRRN